MTYQRVLPRDLFNEAKLLKCLGKIVLDIEDGKLPWLTYDYHGEGFAIHQDNTNGSLYVANLQFFAAEKDLVLQRPLNSRESWPLVLETENNSFAVFNEDGEIILTLNDCKN